MFRRINKAPRIPIHNRKITRDYDRIYPTRFNYINSVADFIACVLSGKAQGYKELIIDFSREDADDKSHFPNIVVPMAAFLDNFFVENDIDIKIENDITNVESTNFLAPMNASKISDTPQVLNRVWKFESAEDVNKLVTAYMDDIYKEDEFTSKDFLDWVEWCLNEVMDNVIQHSESPAGFIMGQVHTSNKTVAFCVADAGRGILRSFRDSSILWPKDARDALEMALREGVTRDPNVGQGNGLWGLHEVASRANGRLRLGSSGSMFQVDENANYIKYPYLNQYRGGTVVDFTFEYSKEVDLRDVLGGHQPESIKVYNALDIDHDVIKYSLIGQRSGFGTRRSGEKIRNEVSNLLLGDSVVELDFRDVNIVSSSFADEFIGKLYIETGPLQFNARVRLTNMNSIIAAIVNKAIMQRIGQHMNDSKTTETNNSLNSKEQ